MYDKTSSKGFDQTQLPVFETPGFSSQTFTNNYIFTILVKSTLGPFLMTFEVGI
jgi:hypothetical protein